MIPSAGVWELDGPHPFRPLAHAAAGGVERPLKSSMIFHPLSPILRDEIKVEIDLRWLCISGPILVCTLAFSIPSPMRHVATVPLTVADASDKKPEPAAYGYLSYNEALILQSCTRISLKKRIQGWPWPLRNLGIPLARVESPPELRRDHAYMYYISPLRLLLLLDE